METQTHANLNSPRGRVFGIIAGVAAFYIWRTFVLGAWGLFLWMIPPKMESGLALGWNFTPDVVYVLPFMVIAVRPNLLNSLLRLVAWPPWRLLFLVCFALIAVRCFNVFAIFALRAHQHGRSMGSVFWADISGWDNFAPGMFLTLLFWLHPARARKSSRCGEIDFELHAAMDDWRRELEAQPNLSVEIRRELETHLHDTTVELQRAGLTEEQAFLQARQRVGQPTELGPEFAKVQRFLMAREMILWAAASILVVFFWVQLIVEVVFGSFSNGSWFWRSGFHYPVMQLTTWLPLFCLALYVARKPVIMLPAFLNKILSNRYWFLATALGLLFLEGSVVFLRAPRGNLPTLSSTARVLVVLNFSVWRLLLIAVVFFLMPAKSVSNSSPAA
jgi:hypothetical protein